MSVSETTTEAKPENSSKAESAKAETLAPSFTPVQKIELGAFAVAGFCAVAAPAIATTHPVMGAIIGSLGAAAVAVKGYLSSSPKDSNSK